MAIRTIRLTQVQTVLGEKDSSGKILKKITDTATGTTAAATTTTTTTVIGSSELTVAGDTNTVKFNVAETNLSIIGGRSIKTTVSNGKLIINLNDAVDFRQAVINSYSAISPLIIKDINGNVVYSVNPSGIPILEPKQDFPTVSSGMIYISGSNALPEGYYVGYPTIADRTAEEANKTDITNI